MHSNIVDTQTLSNHLADPNWLVFDCRFSLADPDKGYTDYQRNRIPGAQYLHLDRDLSAPVVPGKTGRHPLPEPDEFGSMMAERGLSDSTLAVAYDDANGSIAARLWWMLKWIGHDRVALLDGGWQKWVAEHLPVNHQKSVPARGSLKVEPKPEMLVSMDWLKNNLGRGQIKVLDARAPERYRGDTEPIDPVAGHISGALSAPFSENLGPDGTFLAPEILRARLETILQGTPVDSVVCYCGSGVTAAHNVLAFALAGLDQPSLYAGSWSEWITRPENPIAVGSDPE